MTTPTNTFNDRIAARRAALKALRAARKDELDLPRTYTMRQVHADLTETAKIDTERANLEAKVATWAALPPHEPDQRWRDHLTTWRDTIAAERLAIPSPTRDKALMAAAQALDWSLRLIDLGWAANRLPTPIIDLSSTRVGELMAAAGYDVAGLDRLRGPNGFRGSLPEVERRITDLTVQRGAAEQALEQVLIPDDERAEQAADAAALAAAYNAMHVKQGTNGLIAYTDDGAVLDVADMTPVQRRAIERREATDQAYRQSVVDRQSGR